MVHRFLYLLLSMTLTAASVAACAQPSTPTPSIPATPAPSKPAEPTKPAAQATAPAAVATKAPTQDTSAPATKTQFPEKGRTITIMVGYAAGGAVDLGARIIASIMEKDLGTPVVVVNKAGASSQVALTEFVRAKPDGYTLFASSLPSSILTYVDPERKAIYSGKDFLPLASFVNDPESIAVKADSPYKTLPELIAAAKAKPEAIKFGTAGFGNPDHVGITTLEKTTGARFGVVHFSGNPDALTAVLRGDVDATHLSSAFQVGPVKSNQTRVIAVLDKEESKFHPGVKTAVAQGIDHVFVDTRGLALPAGTPKEVVDVLSASAKRAVENPDLKAKMDDMGLGLRFIAQPEYAKHWAEIEANVKGVVGDLRK